MRVDDDCILELSLRTELNHCSIVALPIKELNRIL
jgi:hypothetical protein